jgi:hypothetical protein
MYKNGMSTPEIAVSVAGLNIISKRERIADRVASYLAEYLAEQGVPNPQELSPETYESHVRQAIGVLGYDNVIINYTLFIPMVTSRLNSKPSPVTV